MRISKEKLANMIDHTNLDPNSLGKDVENICKEAKQYGFKGVCVQPWWVKKATKLANQTKIITVISFPFGFDRSAVKVKAAKQAAKDGAHELDMVMNRCAFKEGQFQLVKEDIARVAKATACPVKVIIEACDLSKKEIVHACKISKQAGAAFVKSNTGFGKSGAKAEEIRLMRKTVGNKLGVKAAGGIRNARQALKMIKAGATRIGTSSGPAIIESL